MQHAQKSDLQFRYLQNISSLILKKKLSQISLEQKQQVCKTVEISL